MSFEIANMAVTIGQGNPKSWIDICSDLGPTIIGIATIVVAIAGNCISARNLKREVKQFSIQLKEQKRNLNKQLTSQREQWLNDAYIKQEAEVMLKFRNLILNNQNSFFWFTNLLQPLLVCNKMFPEQNVYLDEENLVIKLKDYCYNYDKFNEIQKFYNDNQIFINKNGIKDEMNYIIAVLETFSFLDSCEDFRYKFVSEDNNCVKYKLDKIEKLAASFVVRIRFLDNCKSEISPKYTQEELKLYADSIMTVYFQLKQKLNEIVTFYDNSSQKDDIIREFYFSTSSERLRLIKEREARRVK